MIFSYIDFVKANGHFDIRRRRQNNYWMKETIDAALLGDFYHRMEIRIDQAEESVWNGQMTPFTAAHSLLDEYYKLIK